MDLKEAQQLLEKYYNGDTSLQEEAQLRTFFGEGGIPEVMPEEQMLFGYYAAASKEQPAKRLNDLLEKSIADKRIVPFSANYLSRAAAAIVACIFILAGFWIVNTGSTKRQPDQKSLIAYVQARKSLMTLSMALNKGGDKVKRISKLNEIQEHISKQK